MDLIVTFLKNAVLVFVGFIGLLFVLALLFGKRKHKRWEYEAEFHDASGREYGEFDIELSRIEKEEADYTFKAAFKMRHERLTDGAEVQVLLDDIVVLKGTVKTAGRVRLGTVDIVTPLTEASQGQQATVLVNRFAIATAELVPD
ncbi:MAG: hypothetical protein AAGI27_12440 [Pseudomonadota bacterium]